MNILQEFYFYTTLVRSLCCRTNTSLPLPAHYTTPCTTVCAWNCIIFIIHSQRTLLCVHEIFSFFIFGVYHDVTMSTTAKCSHMSVCVSVCVYASIVFVTSRIHISQFSDVRVCESVPVHVETFEHVYCHGIFKIESRIRWLRFNDWQSFSSQNILKSFRCTLSKWEIQNWETKLIVSNSPHPNPLVYYSISILTHWMDASSGLTLCLRFVFPLFCVYTYIVYDIVIHLWAVNRWRVSEGAFSPNSISFCLFSCRLPSEQKLPTKWVSPICSQRTWFVFEIPNFPFHSIATISIRFSL